MRTRSPKAASNPSVNKKKLLSYFLFCFMLIYFPVSNILFRAPLFFSSYHLTRLLGFFPPGHTAGFCSAAADHHPSSLLSVQLSALLHTHSNAWGCEWGAGPGPWSAWSSYNGPLRRSPTWAIQHQLPAAPRAMAKNKGCVLESRLRAFSFGLIPRMLYKIHWEHGMC